ncbi:hypothetical protein PRUPE_1G103600 [Prunus persica]|uniref:Diacylglycerol O-acyltransferase n=1 Tax=Prunus persica TaxID=3760 RepID=M5XS92_PRUPE|nr:diacylglycerol O-acyltransferase 3, cytosolic [Prunus persica]ONI27751.1 hypothetical protein PRUPE_1G103600 [Prunus persica]
MEVSGVVSRQVPCFSGAEIDTTRSSTASFHGEFRVQGRRNFGVSLRTRRFGGQLNSGFCDDGHVQYYHVGPRCGFKKEKEIKKKLKLLKGLSKDLSASSQMGFGPLDYQKGLVAQFQEKLISEDAEALLLKQLEQLRAEEKELKRKRKEEKARLKAERMKNMVDSESSSSSSSESSESECGELVDMNRLRSEAPAKPILDSLQPFNHQEGAVLTLPSSLAIATHQENTTVEHVTEFGISQNQEAECCSGTSTSCVSSSGSIGHNDALSSSVMGASALKIEVCMGNKCKKSGGGALLEEFERVMGVEGTVVGCKCMGKCKNGPNIRVSNTVGGIQSEGTDDSVRVPTNPLYIGVGLEDVSLIVANLIGEDNEDLGLVPAA